MKIGIVIGSPREHSQSTKVAAVIKKQLDSLDVEPWIYSLEANPIPLWEEAIWNDDKKWQALLNPIKEKLAQSDAFVIICPEYHGQVPSALKNFFLMFSRFELGNKPAQIVAVSSGDGGSYPVAELRMSSYKNNRICYIPDHLIIRNVETVLNEKQIDNNLDADKYFRKRIKWSAKILIEYAKALKLVRASGVTETQTFSNGM